MHKILKPNRLLWAHHHTGFIFQSLLMGHCEYKHPWKGMATYLPWLNFRKNRLRFDDNNDNQKVIKRIHRESNCSSKGCGVVGQLPAVEYNNRTICQPVQSGNHHQIVDDGGTEQSVCSDQQQKCHRSSLFILIRLLCWHCGGPGAEAPAKATVRKSWTRLDFCIIQ